VTNLRWCPASTERGSVSRSKLERRAGVANPEARCGRACCGSQTRAPLQKGAVLNETRFFVPPLTERLPAWL